MEFQFFSDLNAIGVLDSSKAIAFEKPSLLVFFHLMAESPNGIVSTDMGAAFTPNKKRKIDCQNQDAPVFCFAFTPFKIQTELQIYHDKIQGLPMWLVLSVFNVSNGQLHQIRGQFGRNVPLLDKTTPKSVLFRYPLILDIDNMKKMEFANEHKIWRSLTNNVIYFDEIIDLSNVPMKKIVGM